MDRQKQGVRNKKKKITELLHHKIAEFFVNGK